MLFNLNRSTSRLIFVYIHLFIITKIFNLYILAYEITYVMYSAITLYNTLQYYLLFNETNMVKKMPHAQSFKNMDKIVSI